MSVDHVVLSAADEKYAPPEQVITMSTAIGDDKEVWVFFDLDKYEETNTSRSHTTITHLPPIRLQDLIRGLTACEPTMSAFIERVIR